LGYGDCGQRERQAIDGSRCHGCVEPACGFRSSGKRVDRAISALFCKLSMIPASGITAPGLLALAGVASIILAIAAKSTVANFLDGLPIAGNSVTGRNQRG